MCGGPTDTPNVAATPLPVRRILMLEPFRRVPGFDIAPGNGGNAEINRQP